MAIVERSGVVYLDFESDPESEDLPTPLVHVNPKTKPKEPHVVVLSDSSDEDEDEVEVEELKQIPLGPPRLQRLQASNLNQRHSPAPMNRFTRNSMQAIDNPGQWEGTIRLREEPSLVQQSPLPQSVIPIYPAHPVRDEPQGFWDGQIPAVAIHDDFPPPYPQVDDSFPATARPSVADNEIDFAMLLEDPTLIDFLSHTSPPQHEVSIPEELNPQDVPVSISFEEALSIVLDVLPDVCTDFVREKYDKRLSDIGHIEAHGLFSDILAEKSYPKQKISKKRKRGEGSLDDEEQDAAIKEIVSQGQLLTASKVLRKRFPAVPVQYIDTMLKSKKTVYETIRTLMTVEKSPHSTDSPFRPLRRPRPGSMSLDDIGDAGLRAQFEAAYQRIAFDESVAMQQQKKIEEDAEATKRAFELNDVSECQCCFDTYPNVKMVICDGEIPHAFCMDCLTGHIKAQMDLQKHEIRCMDGSSCKALFSRSTKQKALDTATFARLERIEQQNVLRESGLDLDQCPFCDFAAICPPIEEDRELRCQGPDCGVVSCRLCKQKSHIPLTCEEHKKEQGVDERHIIEEEMTKAFLRMCPKCNIPIYKDGGCNKITCSVCHSFICDVCGKDITAQGYAHFGRNCPQSDERSSAARAAERVKAAEKAAKEDVLASNPDLKATDLEFKMSEKLTAPTKQNARRGQAALADYHRQLDLLDRQRRHRATIEAHRQDEGRERWRREHPAEQGELQEQARLRTHDIVQRQQRAQQEYMQRQQEFRQRQQEFVQRLAFQQQPEHQQRQEQDYRQQLALLEAQNRRRLLEQRAPATPAPRNPVVPNPAAQTAALGNDRAQNLTHGVYPVESLLNPLMGIARERAENVQEAYLQTSAQTAWSRGRMTDDFLNERPMILQPLALPYFPPFTHGLYQNMRPTILNPGYPGPEIPGPATNYRYTHTTPNELPQMPQLPQQL